MKIDRQPGRPFRKADFARLCGVSDAMIAKYSRAGLIVAEGRDVDVLETLRRLRGRLDESRRVAAIVNFVDSMEKSGRNDVPPV